jgi:hypothetical protein
VRLRRAGLPGQPLDRGAGARLPLTVMSRIPTARHRQSRNMAAKSRLGLRRSTASADGAAHLRRRLRPKLADAGARAVHSGGPARIQLAVKLRGSGQLGLSGSDVVRKDPPPPRQGLPP